MRERDRPIQITFHKAQPGTDIEGVTSRFNECTGRGTDGYHGRGRLRIEKDIHRYIHGMLGGDERSGKKTYQYGTKKIPRIWVWEFTTLSSESS